MKKLSKKITKLYIQFVESNSGNEPKRFFCDVKFTDGDVAYGVEIAICDIYDGDDVFYYVRGLKDICSLTEQGISDFIIIDSDDMRFE